MFCMRFKTGVVVSSNLKLYTKYVNKVLTTINKIVDAMEAVNENIKANIYHRARRLLKEPDNWPSSLLTLCEYCRSIYYLFFFFYKFCLIVSKLKVKREGYIKVWLDGYCWNMYLVNNSNFTAYTFYIYETKKEDLRSYIQEHSICWSALRIFNKCYDIKVISIALLMPV